MRTIVRPLAWRGWCLQDWRRTTLAAYSESSIQTRAKIAEKKPLCLFKIYRRRQQYILLLLLLAVMLSRGPILLVPGLHTHTYGHRCSSHLRPSYPRGRRQGNPTHYNNYYTVASRTGLTLFTHSRLERCCCSACRFNEMIWQCIWSFKTAVQCQ